LVRDQQAPQLGECSYLGCDEEGSVLLSFARIEKEFASRSRVFEEKEREARILENDEVRLVTTEYNCERSRTGK
jgi:hypothetical protein